jgi:predicted O-methyltransferase YrrM
VSFAAVHYLDALDLLGATVGYGALGLGGSLGYEGKQVSVQGRHYPHAISSHPPASLRFKLGHRFASFSCQVALNDDVSGGASHADFAVLADGQEVVVEPYVRAGEAPRTLTADIAGAELIELAVRTSRWECSHAVWLDPQVSGSPAVVNHLVDCLDRAKITLPHRLPRAKRCIATVVSPRFEPLLDDMLGSLCACGHCEDSLLVVFVLNGNEACLATAAKYGATTIRCQPQARMNPMSKALLYSVARVIEAEYFLCLDADMLVLGDLRPVFSMIEACPEGRVLACREGNSLDSNRLGKSLRDIYGGNGSDLERLQIKPDEEAYPLVVNDGLFAGGRSALLALDGSIRAMPQASAWVDGHARVSWRNQFIFNLALARLQCGVELDSTFNVQLHGQDVVFHEEGARLRAIWRGRPARVLHFSGGAKRKYPQWQGKFASIHDPLPATDAIDAYCLFLETVRAWVGRNGLKALAWSAYGLSNGENARVGDPSTLPLFAALHYLIRANGCVRVLETGTARGVSAACLASAVAHRNGGRVVTLDPFLHPGREQLWATLPASFSACIEPRQIDSLTGLAAAIENAEHYEAVLLDSIHSAEHVWAEFQLAAALVCPGGLILIHDAVYVGGTVGAALRRIEASGYSVVRLWTADAGISEDDHLGLAVIENRQRLDEIKPQNAAAPAFPAAAAEKEQRP